MLYSVPTLPRLGGRGWGKGTQMPGKGYSLCTECFPCSPMLRAGGDVSFQDTTKARATCTWTNAWAPSTPSVKRQGGLEEVRREPRAPMGRWRKFIQLLFWIPTMYKVRYYMKTSSIHLEPRKEDGKQECCKRGAWYIQDGLYGRRPWMFPDRVHWPKYSVNPSNYSSSCHLPILLSTLIIGNLWNDLSG